MHKVRFQLEHGDRNVGAIYLPDDLSTTLPVLVVCFGGLSNDQLSPFTQELCLRGTQTGLAVVTFDFYGWGDTGGDLNAWTYGRFAANLADVCTYISARERADAERISGLGVSAGSTAVLRCAIEARKLAAGICVATYLGHHTLPIGPAKLLVDNIETLIAGGTVAVRGSTGTTVSQLGLGFFKDAIGGAPIYRLHEVTCPVLFLQGGADNAFRRSDARLGYELLRSYDLPAAHVEIEAGDHILGNVPSEATTAVLAWLREVAFLR